MKSSSVSIFRVKGYFREGRSPKIQSRFSREITAIKKEDALEKILSEIGSKHRVKRRSITIEKIELLKSPDEITDPNIKKFVELNKDEIIIPLG